MGQGKLLKELLTEYALRGVRDWRDLSRDLQDTARTFLQNRIVETEGDCRYRVSLDEQEHFFPMPRGTRARQPSCCFFRVRMEASFELFVLVGCENSLAFRFEPADEESSAHNYPHMQFCVNFQNLRPGGVPEWLPQSYPAFPLPHSDPTKLFLAMLTSIHGRSGGVDEILREMFLQANKPTQWRKCSVVLNEMLGARA